MGYNISQMNVRKKYGELGIIKFKNINKYLIARFMLRAFLFKTFVQYTNIQYNIYNGVAPLSFLMSTEYYKTTKYVNHNIL